MQRRYGGQTMIDSGFSESNDAYFFLAYTHSQDGQVTVAHGITDIRVVKTDKTESYQAKMPGSSNTDYEPLLSGDHRHLSIRETISSDGNVTGFMAATKQYVILGCFADSAETC